jgi:hypothetical protein
MTNHWINGMFRRATALAFSLLLLALNSEVLLAQAPARPNAAQPPDLSGMWVQPPGGPVRRFTVEDAPLQSWALELYKGNRAGITNPNDNGQDPLDPSMYCIAAGVPRIMTSPFPIEIVQAPGRVYMIPQSQQNPMPRYIYTDGRGHPEGFPVTVMGHSIGRWDRDILVVDTTLVDGNTWMDGIGTPHSEELHVVERLRRAAQDTLEAEFRFEDPKAFTRPWGGKKVYKLTEWEYISGHVCDDRFRAEFEKRSLRDKKDWIEFGK